MHENKTPVTLADTAKLMESDDYKDRFVAEYRQLEIRERKLQEMLGKWDRGEINFKPSCPRSIYDLQLKSMSEYRAVLEARAAIEGVEI